MVVLLGAASTACGGKGDSSTAAGEGTPTAAKADATWFEVVPAFPGAVERGSEHIAGTDGAGGAVHIQCNLYATPSPLQEVVDFYSRRLPSGKHVPPAAWSATIERAAGAAAVDVSVYRIESAAYPRCGGSTGPDDRTVILVSQKI
jgi:hypothetical protein